MKHKKKLFMVMFIAGVLLALISCGESPDMSKENSEGSLNFLDTETGLSNSEEKDSYGEGTLEEEPSDKDSKTSFERKIVKNAMLEMEAKDASDLYSKITNHGNELGGYEFSYDISNEETYTVIHAVYKIPPEKLKQFIDFAGETGRIINNTMSSEDITDSYYDIKTRLETKRKSLEQYYKLLEKAKTIQEITNVQSTIDQITEEIEVNEGKLKMWDNLVDMATVELYIRQENDPVKIEKEIHWDTLSISDMGYLIKSGLVSLLNVIVSIIQWIVIAIVVTSPIWIVVGIVLWICLKARRRKKSEKVGG